MLDYEIVDVFTDRPYAGNPLAVVLDADRLGTAELQAMAREFNLSETAFPLLSATADYRLRIFTPAAELPFAGHPSVGTAVVLARLGRLATGAVRQECGAGILRLEVEDDRATLTGAPPSARPAPNPDPLLAAVGLGPGDLAGLPGLAGTGLEFGYLPVHPDAVRRARLDLVGLAAVPAAGVCVFDYSAGAVRARVFAADVGEDPATGSAALGLGAHLAATGQLPEGETAYAVHQGAEVGRPSTLECATVVRAGQAVECRVTGRVVPVAQGKIRRP